MSFLNPILLFGLAAISVPIIIHLLNRRRFQKVVWAAMRFIKTSVEQNQKRMRMEDLILLALRCLLVALLALALARPALLSDASAMFGRSKVTGVIILDNSYSMGMSDGTRTRFDQARRAAEQALDSMPAGSATAVFLASDVVRGVIPEPTFDLNLARKIIRDAPLSDRGTDLFPALAKAVDTLKDRLAIRREIYLVTDGQAQGWRQLTEIQRLLERAKTEIKTQIILVTDNEQRNLGVSELRLAGGLSPAGQPLRFEVKISNYGQEEARDVPVSLNVNGEPPSDEFTAQSLPSGATRSITMFAKLRSDGFHSVTARIPEDRLHADDQRTVAIHAIKEIRVLLVDGEPGDEPRDSEVFFVRNALVPVPPEAATDYFTKTTLITAPELSQARLDDFDAVVLANVPDLSEATLSALRQYLRRGGGLIVFLGARVNVSFYNEQLFTRLNLLPGMLGSPRGQADQDEQFFTLQDKDYEHSIATIWNDPASGSLASTRFFKAFELKPPAAGVPEQGRPGETTTGPPRRLQEHAGVPQVVIKFKDGTPAVMERTWGLGRVVLFSSTADTAWNDLAVRPAFIPLVHRVLGAVVQRQDEGLNVRVGEKFVRRVSTEFLEKDAIVFKPRQTDVVRELRRIELVEGWPVIQFDQTDLAGLYDVTVTDPALALKFAAQPDANESNLEELSSAQRDVLKGAATLIDWTPNSSLRGLVEKGRSGLELWLPLALLALSVAVLETYLAQWFTRSK